MKILLVANVGRGHVNKFHIPTIQYLQAQNWQVDVACSVDEPIEAGDNIYAMCWKRSPFTFKTIQGIFQLKKLIAKNNYDIIYCHTPVGGVISRLAVALLRGKKPQVAYFAHGLHFFKGAPLLNWLLYYPIEKLMSYFTNLFITINPEDYNLVRKHFNQKMKVALINGIGVDFNRLKIDNREAIRQEYRTQLNIPQDAIALIYVAEVSKNKNQEMLIRLVENMNKQSNHNVYLLLAGSLNENGAYIKLANQLGIKDKIRFLGWRKDIAQLMNTADICVASSIREGFGINLIEAQYCHLPIVAVSNRGHNTIIKDGENGFLVPLNDYHAMQEKVELLINDKNLYHKMANINVEKYQSSNIIKELYHLLSDLKTH